jgi:hypothetical protein
MSWDKIAVAQILARDMCASDCPTVSATGFVGVGVGVGVGVVAMMDRY